MGIRFIYFDLGNVLVNFSIQRMLFQVSQLTKRGEEEVRQIIFGGRKYQQLETGEIDETQYFEMICNEFGFELDVDQFKEATNNIFWVNDSILPITRHLAKKFFPRGILSNAGPQHWEYVQRTFDCITTLFPRHQIASCQVKCMKPFPEIYEVALQHARREIPDLEPAEILFFDDLPANCKGAEEFGFIARTYTDTPTLITQFRAFDLPLPDSV